MDRVPKREEFFEEAEFDAAAEVSEEVRDGIPNRLRNDMRPRGFLDLAEDEPFHSPCSRARQNRSEGEGEKVGVRRGVRSK